MELRRRPGAFLDVSLDGAQFAQFKRPGTVRIQPPVYLSPLLMAPTSGAAPPTVEPATLALVGTGLVGFRFARRKLPFQS